MRMGLPINIFLTVVIVLMATVIPAMLFAAATDFKYEWLNKLIDGIYAVFVPVLIVMLAVALFAGAGLLLYAIWCA